MALVVIVSRISVQKPGEAFGHADIGLVEMVAFVPLQSARDSCTGQTGMNASDGLPYCGHHGITGPLFPVAEAEIYRSGLRPAGFEVINETWKPYRGGYRGDTFEQRTVAGCPKGEKAGKRVSAYVEVSLIGNVLREDSIEKEGEGFGGAVSERGLTEHGRDLPGGKVMVPGIDLDGEEGEVPAGAG